MKIALTRKNKYNKPPQAMNHPQQRRHLIRSRNFSSKFRRKMALILQYFFTPETNNKKIQTEATIVYRNHPFTL